MPKCRKDQRQKLCNMKEHNKVGDDIQKTQVTIGCH